jgi:hypothetical protein
MAKNDCFVYYIIATMLDGTKKVHSFSHLIGTKCSYKYVNMKGEVVDLSNYTERTLHPESSLDSTLGNIIHETTEKSSGCCKATCSADINSNAKIGNKANCIKHCCGSVGGGQASFCGSDDEWQTCSICVPDYCHSSSL